MHVQGVCPTIQRRINETAKLFLAKWNLQNEAAELGRWQNLINYLVAKNEEEVQESGRGFSVFMTRVKEKDKEISDMILAIKQYLNEHTELRSPIDIFDLHAGKNILEIIIDKENTLAKSIDEIYRQSISPTDAIWDLYCMVQTRNHICIAESMDTIDIVYFIARISKHLVEDEEQSNHLVSYLIDNVLKLLSKADNDAKQRALSIFCLESLPALYDPRVANINEDTFSRLKIAVDEAFIELVKSATKQPTIIGSIGSSHLATLNYFSSRPQQWWEERVSSEPKAICASAAQHLEKKGLREEASLCLLSSQYNLDFDTGPIDALEQICSLLDRASNIEMKKVVDHYEINDYFLADSFIYEITEIVKSKIQEIKRSLNDIEMQKEASQWAKEAVTDLPDISSLVSDLPEKDKMKLASYFANETVSKYSESIFIALSKLDDRFAKLAYMEERIDRIRERFGLVKTGREMAFVSRTDLFILPGIGLIALGKALAPFVAGWAVGKVLDKAWDKIADSRIGRIFRRKKKEEALSKLSQQDINALKDLLEKTKDIRPTDTHSCKKCGKVFYGDDDFVQHVITTHSK